MRRIDRILLLFFILTSFSSLGQKQVDIYSLDTPINVGNYIGYCIDSTYTNSLPQIVKNSKFIYPNQSIPNLGMTDKPVWIKLEFGNIALDENVVFQIDNSNLNEVEIYHQLKSDSILKVFHAGENQPFDNREVIDPTYVVNFTPSSLNKSILYIKLTASESILVPIKLLSEPKFVASTKRRELLIGLYAGLMLAMFLYNLFIFFSVKDKSYLYYVVYLFSIAISQVTLLGYTFMYLWPENTWLAPRAIYLFSAVSGIALVMFLYKFLNIKSLSIWLYRILFSVIAIYIVAFIVAVAGDLSTGTKMLDLGGGLLMLFALISGIVGSIKKSRAAYFFLGAWGIFIFGVVIFVMRNSGVLPSNDFTNYTMTFGTAIETLLLSFALADRINIMKVETEQSQKRALEASMENERLVREQNITLEQKVVERTSELSIANRELSDTLVELKNTQSKLVDQEKMASLGQLTAGIAHEINNPINFVSANVKPLKRDIEDILEVLDKYDSIASESQFASTKEEIEDLKEEIEISIIRDELDSLLLGIEDGANRTAEIVKGLKTFSRMDEQDLKMVDLVEGINSTLTLLNSSALREVEIIKDFDAVSRVECYAGKINQVFMNIINNSVHAMEVVESDRKGILNISVKEKDDTIIVKFKDNGVGIEEDLINKIFDPFFTTKEVGTGTGLGLSISLSIIEKHNGKIECKSEKGIGTEFIITLPKIQSLIQS